MYVVFSFKFLHALLTLCRDDVTEIVQLEDLAKVSITGQVVQAAKLPTSNAYRRGDTSGTRSRYGDFMQMLPEMQLVLVVGGHIQFPCGPTSASTDTAHTAIH